MGGGRNRCVFVGIVEGGEIEGEIDGEVDGMMEGDMYGEIVGVDSGEIGGEDVEIDVLELDFEREVEVESGGNLAVEASDIKEGAGGVRGESGVGMCVIAAGILMDDDEDDEDDEDEDEIEDTTGDEINNGDEEEDDGGGVIVVDVVVVVDSTVGREEDEGEVDKREGVGEVEGGEGGRMPEFTIVTSNPHASRVLNRMELCIKFTNTCKILALSVMM